ncbi:hypothetical protein WHZ96_08840 [Klebsiella pneumoniae]
MGEISVKTGNNARNGGKNSLNRLIRCVCGKKIGPDPRNFNQRVSLGRNDLLIRTFPNQNAANREKVIKSWGSEVEANTAILQNAVQRFFPDAVIEKFNTAGLLNDPDLVNAVLAIGKALGEDKTVTAAATGNAAEKDIAHRMWPNMQ